MPTQPPRFNAGIAKRRKAWARSAHQPDRRLRGRTGKRERARILAEEPLCRPCLAADRVSASIQVDHITPLSEGGSDDRSNKQGICIPCHEAKSAAERAAARRRRDPTDPTA
jgi:5-methylcytosine-specific restriction protein A